MTDIDDPKVDVNACYCFDISEKTKPDYKMTSAIIEWLQENMENLLDDEDNQIFGKVNTGFNEETLRSFGKRPVCDVYLDRVEYKSDFDDHIPEKAFTFLLFHMKGANNATYEKSCELHDLIMQELITNHTFRELDEVVRDTHIVNSEIRIRPLGKKWGLIGAFELEHDLY